jgi:hypothetical protein
MGAIQAKAMPHSSSDALSFSREAKAAAHGQRCNMRAVTRFSVLVGAAALVACATQAPGVSPPQKPAVPSGYRRVMGAKGEELLCRSDLDAGSHVQRTTVCLTPAQLKAIQENSQDFITNVQAGSALSGTGTSGTGMGR